VLQTCLNITRRKAEVSVARNLSGPSSDRLR